MGHENLFYILDQIYQKYHLYAAIKAIMTKTMNATIYTGITIVFITYSYYRNSRIIYTTTFGLIQQPGNALTYNVFDELSFARKLHKTKIKYYIERDKLSLRTSYFQFCILVLFRFLLHNMSEKPCYVEEGQLC